MAEDLLGIEMEFQQQEVIEVKRLRNSKLNPNRIADSAFELPKMQRQPSVATFQTTIESRSILTDLLFIVIGLIAYAFGLNLYLDTETEHSLTGAMTFFIIGTTFLVPGLFFAFKILDAKKQADPIQRFAILR